MVLTFPSTSTPAPRIYPPPTTTPASGTGSTRRPSSVTVRCWGPTRADRASRHPRSRHRHRGGLDRGGVETREVVRLTDARFAAAGHRRHVGRGLAPRRQGPSRSGGSERSSPEDSLQSAQVECPPHTPGLARQEPTVRIPVGRPEPLEGRPAEVVGTKPRTLPCQVRLSLGVRSSWTTATIPMIARTALHRSFGLGRQVFSPVFWSSIAPTVSGHGPHLPVVSALGGTRTPNLLIRRAGRGVRAMPRDAGKCRNTKGFGPMVGLSGTRWDGPIRSGLIHL